MYLCLYLCIHKNMKYKNIKSIFIINEKYVRKYIIKMYQQFEIMNIKIF